MFSFNLVIEPWIPIVIDGKLEEYSIKQVLLEASLIDRIEDPSPLIVVALHRLLLAIIHRASNGPEDSEQTADWFEDGLPRQAIGAYLNKWQYRFDIFDDDYPFYQTANYSEKEKSIGNLIPERASGTNKLLFDHGKAVETRDIMPAELARLLIARQMLAIPEGAGYSPSPIGGSACIIPMGKNLQETLCLNLMPYSGINKSRDIPIWEVENSNPDYEQEILGLTHRYTWMSRHIRFIPELISGNITVQNMYYGPASKLKKLDIFNPDPMLAYHVVDIKKGEKRALRFNPNKSFWRDYSSLVPAANNDAPLVLENTTEILLDHLDNPVRVPILVAGASNDKAKFIFWRTELYALPKSLVGDRSKTAYAELEWALSQAEELGKALYSAVYLLAKQLLSMGDRDPDKSDVSNLAKSIPASLKYWSSLDAKFPELINILDSDFMSSRLRRFWSEALIQSVNEAWKIAKKSAGDDARALRAIYTAENLLIKSKAKLKSFQTSKEVV